MNKKEEQPVKVNPFELKRPKPKTITKVYTDPQNPTVELTLSFRSMDQAEQIMVMEQTERSIAQYMGTEEQPPMAFPLVDGQPVKMSQTLISNSAFLANMETSKLYTLEDFISFSVVMPTAYGQMLKDCTELNRSEQKNA